MEKIPSIAKRVRSLREAAGLSQQDLAVRAGLSVSLIGQIEQGKKLDPRVSTVQALAAALGVDWPALLGDARRKVRKRAQGAPW